MPQVVLQPVDEIHYSHTIAASVPLSTIIPLLTNDESRELRDEFPQGTVCVWGIESGEKDINVHRWQKLRKGDIVLFVRRKQVIARAEVKYTTDNKRLAEFLWPENASGRAWRYVYFVQNITPSAIPIEEVNKWAEYHPDFIVHGFMVLDQHKSNSILDHLNQFQATTKE